MSEALGELLDFGKDVVGSEVWPMSLHNNLHLFLESLINHDGDLLIEAVLEGEHGYFDLIFCYWVLIH